MRVTLRPPPGPFEDPFLGNSPFPLPYPPPHNVTCDGTSQFRAEAFDLANHPNFNPPVGNLSSATYGQIAGSAAGRILQGAIKLRW
jgi:hypothetical protein